MRVLVATSTTQGEEPDDYDWCIDGELVWFPPACDCNDCGCFRGFGGIDSRRATTTALIVERPDLGFDDYVAALKQSIRDQGYPEELVEEWAEDDVAMFENATRVWPVGTVLERFGDHLRIRGSGLPRTRSYNVLR